LVVALAGESSVRAGLVGEELQSKYIDTDNLYEEGRRPEGMG